MATTTITRPDWSRADLWASPPRKRWTGKHITLALIWLLVVNVVASIPAVIYLATHPDTDPTTVAYHPLMLTGGMLALWSVFAGYPLLVTHLHSRRSLRLDFGWSFKRRDWLVGLTLGLSLRALDIGLGWLAPKFIDMEGGDNSAWLFMDRHWAWTVFFVLGASVIAPALEELFFRGFLLRSVLRVRVIPRRWRVRVAVIGSSLVFGLMHLTGATVGGVYVVVLTGSLGAVLAVRAVRDGRLGASVATHVVFNSTGVALAFLMR